MHYTPTTIPAEAADALRPAFDCYGVYGLELWLQRCREDSAQLWRHESLWAVTEVNEFAKLRACHIVAMSGDFSQDLMDEIEAWARSVGCQQIYFTGRRGWERRLPDYKPTAIIMRKEFLCNC